MDLAIAIIMTAAILSTVVSVIDLCFNRTAFACTRIIYDNLKNGNFDIGMADGWVIIEYGACVISKTHYPIRAGLRQGETVFFSPKASFTERHLPLKITGLYVKIQRPCSFRMFSIPHLLIQKKKKFVENRLKELQDMVSI